MRKYISRFLSSTAFLVFIGLFAFFSTMVSVDPAKIEPRELWKLHNTVKENVIRHSLADVVSYKKGVKSHDSVVNILMLQDQVNYGLTHQRDFSLLPLWELRSVTECNSCDMPGQGENNSWNVPEQDRLTTTYIAINGYQLKDDRTFLRANKINTIIGRPFTPAGNFDSAVLKTGFPGWMSKYFKNGWGSVSFRYDYWNRQILIPVNTRTYDTLKLVTQVFGAILFAYAFFLLLYLPYRIILNIVKGRAFQKSTIKMIDFIAYNFLLYPFILFLLRQIVQLIFSRYIQEDFSSFAFKELMGSSVFFYIGLFFLSLGVALKRGNFIQQEQDLTI